MWQQNKGNVMGQFSFKCAISKESISNIYKEDIYLVTPLHEKKYLEKEYEGYGKFGGIDVYEWMGKTNFSEKELENLNSDEIRSLAINLHFLNVVPNFPIKIVKAKYYNNEKYEDLAASEDCPNQGWVDLDGKLDSNYE